MELTDIYKKLTWNIMRSYGKTYSLATRFYPKSVRHDVAALYAFVRIADEIVDNPEYVLTNEEKSSLLSSYESGLKKTLKIGYSTDPILQEVSRVITSHNIPISFISSFISSMKMDISKNKYATFNELQEYTYGSAEVIGLMMICIMKGDGAIAASGAAKLGLAFQLTNFLRDVKSDYELLGRIYLPKRDLEKFSVSYNQIKQGKSDKNWSKFVSYWVQRNAEFYDTANEAIKHLPAYAQRPIRIASSLYQDIDNHLVKNPSVIFKRRYSVPLHQKISRVLFSNY